MKKILLSLFLCLTLGTAAAWAQDYELVTSNDQIEEGGEYIVVCNTKNVAMSTLNGTIFSKVDVTINGSTIALAENANVLRISIETSGSAYRLKTNSGYIYISGDKKMSISSTASTSADATISVASNGNATIGYQYNSKTYNLQYNAQSPRFTGYTSAQTAVQLYKKVEAVAAAPEAITATIDGEAIEAEQTVANGTVVTFESKNAGALKINGETVENPYKYEVNFGDAKTLEVTVEAVPADDYTPAEGEEMPVATYTFVREAAAECGAVEFNIEGGAVYEGTTIFLSCENAATIMYAVNGGAEQEYNAETGITVSEACTIAAYGINVDGVHGETAEYTFTIKEADRYKLVTSTANIKSGAKYIIVSEKGHGLGAYKDKNQYAPVESGFSYSDDKTIITPEDNCGLNILTITESGNGYTIHGAIDDAYFTVSGTSLNITTSENSAAKFEFDFDGSWAQIRSIGTTSQILFNVNSPMFRHYASTNASQKNYEKVSLYRLIDEDYVAAPDNLYLHGDFYDARWERSIEMERNGYVFTLTDIMIGHEEGGQHYLFATFPKADPNESTTERIRRKADTTDAAATVAQEYWNGSEGHVFIPNGDGTATRLHTSEINGDITPATAETRGRYYDLTADFSGFTPTFAISEAKENPTTGAATVEADANAPVEYFNLQGIRVENPENGLYIRRQGSNTTKVYIR